MGGWVGGWVGGWERYLEDSPGESVAVEEVGKKLSDVPELVGFKAVDGGVLLVEGFFEGVLLSG